MPEPTPVVIPRESVNDETVTLVAWCVANGATVEAEQALAEVEGSKAVFTIPAPVAGVVQYTLAAGQEIEVGGVLCAIYRDETPSCPAAALPIQPETKHVAAAAEPQPDNQPVVTETTSVLLDTGNGTAPVPPTPSLPRFSRKAVTLLQQHSVAPELFAGQGLVRAQQVLAVLGEQVPQTTLPPNAAPQRQEADRARPGPMPP